MPSRARKSTSAASVADDPFQYGWRYRKHTLPDGREELEQIPLTLEDVLHPEEEDFHIHTKQHRIECAYLTSVLESRPLSPPFVEVTSDQRIDWGIEGLGVHGPDLAVFVGLKQPLGLDAGTMYLAELGGQCVLAVEIVSPSTRENDVGPKLDHYHRARVGFYAIVDQLKDQGPRALLGYRWTKSGFKKVKLNPEGSLDLVAVGLQIELRSNRLVCRDLETGREYLQPNTNITQLEQADLKISEQGKLLEEAILAGQQRQDDLERRLSDADECRRQLEERVRHLEKELSSKKRRNGSS